MQVQKIGSKYDIVVGRDGDFQQQLDFIKGLDGRRFDPNTKHWSVPVTKKNTQALASARSRLPIHGIDFSTVEKEQTAHQAALADMERERSALATAPIKSGLGGELRHYQEEGVRHLVARGGGYLGDEMGLGKTVTALAAVHQSEKYPALVLCPSIVATNWQKEAEKWLPGKTVQRIKTGKDKADPKADVVICTYGLADKLAKQDGLQFQTLIADEAHYLKSGKAQRTKAVREMAKGIAQKILLSGTPVTRAPVDLYSQIDIMGKTDRFGSYREFTKLYCGGHYENFRYAPQPVWAANGATNVEELAERLKTDLGYLRREKTLVAKELPEKTRQVLAVPLEAADYRNLRAIAAKGDPEVPGSILYAMQEQLGYIGRAKIEPAKEWIADFVEENPSRKLIVFAQHIEVQKELAESLKEHGHGIVTILGEHSATQRGVAVEQFQNDPRTQIAVCSLGAASVGVTLTAASDVLMVEQDWTPATLLQAEDRAHRIGQKNAVNVTYLVAENTLDSERMDVIQRKLNIANALNQSVQAEFVQRMEQAAKKSVKRSKSKGLEIE